MSYEIIKEALSFLEDVHEYFQPLVKVATKGKWIKKPRWFPFENFCTTLGNTVYLSKRFFDESTFYKASLILHESVHLRQYQVGTLRFLLNYAFPSKRLNLELEAIEQEIFWAVYCKYIPILETDYKIAAFVRSNAYILSQLNSISYDYSMKVSSEMLFHFATETIKKAYPIFFPDRFTRDPSLI